MVSHPTYDPNRWPATTCGEVETQLRTRSTPTPASRCSTARSTTLYPPGSTFKLVTAAAALSTGEYTENSVLPGPAVLDLPRHHGRPAQRRRPRLRPERRGHADRGAGGLVQHRLRLPRAWSSAPTRCRRRPRSSASATRSRCRCGSPRARVPAELNEPQPAQSAIGQYDVRVTPLQMAMVAAGVANGGVVMKPYLVQAVIGSDLVGPRAADPQELSQAVTPEVAAQLTRMMEAVVEDGTGTARPDPGRRASPARPAPRSTARAARRTPGSSRSPRPTTRKVAVAVIVEDGGVAGSEAGRRHRSPPRSPSR